MSLCSSFPSMASRSCLVKKSAEELLLFCDRPGIDLSEFTWQSFVELYSEASSGRIGSCQSSKL